MHVLVAVAHQGDRDLLEAQSHRPEDEGQRHHDGEHGERLEWRQRPAHEERDHGLDGQSDQRREGERVIEAHDLAVAQCLASVTLTPEQPVHRRACHDPAGDGFRRNTGGQSRGSHPRARGRDREVEHERRGRHGREAEHRTVGDEPGTPAADQEPLIEPPVPDRSRPGEEQPKRHVREVRHVVGNGDQVEHHVAEYRWHQQRQHGRRDRRIEHVGERAEAPEAVRVFGQGRRCAHDHDDGGLDQQGEGVRHTVGREVERGIHQPGDDRREEGPLDRHHEPRGGQRNPKSEDGTLRELQTRDSDGSVALKVPGDAG